MSKYGVLDCIGPDGEPESVIIDPDGELDVTPSRAVQAEMDALVDRLAVEKYSAGQPRDQRGRWTTGSFSTAATQLQEHGGFTVHPLTAEQPHEGFALSKWPERSLVFSAKDMSKARVARRIRRWLTNNKDLIGPDHYIGGWLDTDSGNVYIDFSVVYPPNRRAEAIADAKAANQKAIFDLGAMEEIDTGGTGEALAKAADNKERFFIRTEGKSVDDLVEDIMEVLGLSEDDED